MSFIQSNAVGTTFVSNGIVAATTTIYNVSIADSGKLCFLQSTAAAAGTVVMNVNLPAVQLSAGLRYKFIFNSPLASRLAGNNITITSSASLAPACLRSVIAGTATGATGGTQNNGLGTTLTILPIAGGASGVSIGDCFDCWSDGIVWWIIGNVNFIGACTIA